MNALLKSWVRPFEESEVTPFELSESKTQDLIDIQNRKIEILEGIQFLETKRQRRMESVEGFGGTFPELRREYIHEIDIINRSINRLYQRFNNQ